MSSEEFGITELSVHVAAINKTLEEVPVTCQICNFMSTSIEMWLNHFETCEPTSEPTSEHTSEPTSAFTCKLCSFGTNVQHKLREHVYHIHQSAHGCSYCVQWFYTAAELQEHIESKCDIEVLRVNIESYEKYIDPNDNLRCILCNRNFIGTTSLHTHIGRAHKPKNFRCKRCSGTFCSTVSCKQHFRDKICDENGKIRKRQHFKCEGCSDVFSTKVGRALHLIKSPCGNDSAKPIKKRHNRRKYKKYQCERCLSVFNYITNFKRHVASNKCSNTTQIS